MPTFFQYRPGDPPILISGGTYPIGRIGRISHRTIGQRPSDDQPTGKDDRTHIRLIRLMRLIRPITPLNASLYYLPRPHPPACTPQPMRVRAPTPRHHPKSRPNRCSPELEPTDTPTPDLRSGTGAPRCSGSASTLRDLKRSELRSGSASRVRRGPLEVHSHSRAPTAYVAPSCMTITIDHNKADFRTQKTLLSVRQYMGG